MKNNGFTLIEIMLVVVIIGVLVAMVAPNMVGRGEQARKTAARTDIDSNVGTALDLYHMDNSVYPTTEQGLAALISSKISEPAPRNWSGPYLKKRAIPKDPWGRSYVYVSPGTHNTDSYDLSSLGADGVESKDDVTNWETETK